jgi:hypothetical protein
MDLMILYHGLYINDVVLMIYNNDFYINDFIFNEIESKKMDLMI